MKADLKDEEEDNNFDDSSNDRDPIQLKLHVIVYKCYFSKVFDLALFW